MRCLLFLVLLCVPHPSWAVTYYTSKTGNDSNTCPQAQTLGTAKLTITSGATCLTPGDTLTVKAGVYAEQFTDEIPGGTSAGTPVRVQAASGETVTIRPGAGQDGALYFTTSTSRFIIIEGFEIDGTGETNGHGIYITNQAHDITVQFCDIHHFYNQGILVSGSGGSGTTTNTNNNQFLNNYVHHNGTRTDEPANLHHGMYIESDGNVVADNNIYSHTGHGVQIYSSHSWQPDNNVVHQNLIYENTTIGIGLYAGTGNRAINNIVLDSQSAGIKTGIGAINSDISHNTIYSINEFGIYVASGTGHLIRNNIIDGSGDWGLWLDTGVSGATVQNNLFYANSDGTIDNDSSGATITGTVTGNPLFVNPASQDTGDFSLQLGSPAINAGVTISSITEDYFSLSRPRDGAYDIGATEYVSAPPLLPRRDGSAEMQLLKWFVVGRLL